MAFIVAGLLVLPSTVAAMVPLEVPIQGIVRDNAGSPVSAGEFAITFTLYSDNEGEESVWTETQGVSVQGGLFRATLGGQANFDPALFAASGSLWLGVQIESEPELPLRPLASTPYAMAAGDAAGLSCSGCVAPEALSDAALQVIREEAVAAGAAAGFAVDAAGLAYDDTTANLGTTTVQGALESLQAMVADNAASLAAGGGDAVEGQGTVRNYVNQWDINGFGSATEYVHVLKPSPPKVLMYLYADVSQNFSTGSNLQVAYDFAPNQYSSGIVGSAGEDVLQVGDPGVFNPGDHILLHQTVGTGGNGAGAGTWELNRVKSVEGGTVSLVKPLSNSYVSSGDNSGRAQAVIAASYNNLEVMSGGTIHPSEVLAGNGTKGGIVYLRTQSLIVRNGGVVEANETGFRSEGYYQQGDSQCKTGGFDNYQIESNCAGGGGAHSSNTCGRGGGANRENGSDSTGNYNSCNNNNYRGKGGQAWGDAEANVLTMGGGGGGDGGYGGGLVVIGSNIIRVDTGGKIEASGRDGSAHGAGGGAGGTIALFADQILNEGEINVPGGAGQNASSNNYGGAGGEGWVHENPAISGIVNESYPKGVEIWVDGVNVTALVGDPNGKGHPTWNADDNQWGADGLSGWSTGVLDLTSSANWTLGEHTVTIKETGGAGGLLKAYIYVVHTYSASQPPVNDVCTSPVALDVTTEPLVISGTTEDLMGKTLATDANQAEGCGGDGGPDVTYRIDLEERSLINVATVSPFPVRLYLRSDDCAGGEVVYCADADFSTTPLEPGTYFLVVDSDDAGAKGNFTLAVSRTPALLPDNDTCDTAMELIFSGQGVATHSGTTLYGLDQYDSFCGGVAGPDGIYKFNAGTGQIIEIAVASDDFSPILYLYKEACGEGSPVFCGVTNELETPPQAGGDYWLVVDSGGEAQWGAYDLTVTLTTP